MCCVGDQRLAGLCHPSLAEEKYLNMKLNAADSAMDLQTFLTFITPESSKTEKCILGNFFFTKMNSCVPPFVVSTVLLHLSSIW